MMLHSINLLYVLVCFGFIVSPVVSDCLNSYDSSVNYYPIEAQILPSQDAGFTVTYQNAYKIVNNTRTNDVYILYCNATAPNVGIPTAKYFQVPVKNVVTLDLPTITFLELMGVYPSVKYVNNTNRVTSPCLQKNIENHLVSNFDWNNITNVDVVFDSTLANNTSKSVAVSLTDDLNPLQKLEWVKFLSYFFDKEAAVNETFKILQYIYNCNTQNLQYVPIANKKKIAWVSYDSISNQFYVKSDNYRAQLIKDAGAYSYKPSISTVNTTDELHKIINNANIVIDESSSIASFDAWQRTFGYYDASDIPDFITHRQVYRVNKLVNRDGYSDWTESAAARPDLAIQDLIAIQYPSYQPSYVTMWLYDFSNNMSPKIVTSNNCVDPNQPQTFETCRSNNFTGDSTSTNGPNSNNGGNNSTKKLSPMAQAFIIVFSILAGLAGFAVGTWLVLTVRRKYQERFIELKDEPEVQMSDVTEPTKTSV